MNKLALITGSTDGIGKETAKNLAKKGYNIILTGRSEKKGNEVKDEFKLLFADLKVTFHPVDFSSQQSIKDLVHILDNEIEQLDVLINNVGLLKSKMVITQDGIEELLAVNYLAAFHLSHLLLDKLKKSEDARIVNVSGGAYKFGKINLKDLNLEKGWTPFKALGQAKLANLIFTYEASQRWKKFGIKTYAADPGAAKTPGHNEHSYFILKWLLPIIGLPREKAALSSVKAASAPELESLTGIFLDKKGNISNIKTNTNKDIANNLWEKSLDLINK